MDAFDLLEKFMLTPAPSGYEREMAYAFRDSLTPYVDELSLDRSGNVIGLIRGRQGDRLPRAMAFAHIDQLGLIVRKVEKDGFLRVDRLGGVPEKVLPGLRLLVRTEDGGWREGVVGVKSHHATAPDEKYAVDPVTSLAIDVGASDDAEVARMGIYVGCPIVYHPAFLHLAGTRVAGTSVDNRGGCTALIGAAESLQRDRPACDVYVVGTVWEEFNLRGAMLAARTVNPDLALMLDVTLSGDTQDLKARYDATLGGGACVELYSFHGRGTLNGTLPHEPLFHLAKRAAEEDGIPFQRFASLGIVTDAAYLQLEGQGVACLEMGFPARYTHSPVEICDTRDIIALSRLAAGTLRRVDAAFSLNRY